MNRRKVWVKKPRGMLDVIIIKAAIRAWFNEPGHTRYPVAYPTRREFSRWLRKFNRQRKDATEKGALENDNEPGKEMIVRSPDEKC